ncbi:MlaD family protein [Moritella viscosa]|uniref:Paraquat-inducible protein B n=1 Tax=Moritella viscosa TaxID=80854 RepID=A0A090IGL8_9GAMM|nr:MlaD family protein [Moritella viscosa]CED60097.1 putative mammalian cell entry protein [Moritella viscosa]SGY99249.1 Paraquat-inducible protein B [Moritella viscosa]SGZ13941.1 Paraquat-inducible protein B [Moritella viscosa]SHO14914.1 Paraquat-inducible protein B [Moritella viscosa]SHO17056.1 Paraquat-inducible protein B [Moritella viscosa]
MKENNEPQMPDNCDAPKAVLHKPNVMSPIWLLPIVAVILGLYLMYQSITQAGIEIRVHFSNANGIVAGKTLVKYQGLIIGKVKKIALDDNLKGVYVTAEIDNKAEQVLRRNTQFWLVAPKASIAGISGLDALVTGNYIDLSPGDGEYSIDFISVQNAPNNPPDDEGLIVHLTADKLSSVRPGSEIFYKKIPVGQVHSFTLDKKTDKILVEAVIDKQYSYLIKDTSRFWNASGINAKFGLDGVKVETESLTAIISGALAFDSPTIGKPANDNQIYPLYNSISDAQRAVQIKLKLSNSNDIKIGNNIYFNGLKVGEITQVMTQSLTPTTQNSPSVATAIADVDPDVVDLFRDSTQFWVEKANLSLSESKNIVNLVTGNYILFTPGQGELRTTFDLVSNVDDLIPHKQISITANDANGLAVGNKVYYKNYPIGHISQVNFNTKTNLIDLNVNLYQDYAHLLTPSSRFINVSGVSVNANISGVNIKSSPIAALVSGGIELVNDPAFKTKRKKQQYRLYPSLALAKLGDNAFKTNKSVTLVSKPNHVISNGAPVYYRKLVVGTVADFRLASDNEHIIITLDILSQYAHLINKNSVFWDVSGVQISGSLSNLQVQAESLLTIAAGGINFDNIKPVNNNKVSLSKSKLTHYKLFRSFAAATDNRPIVTLTFESGTDIHVGTEIKNKGIKVGEISHIKLKVDQGFVEATAKLETDYAKYFTRQGSLYWLESVEVGLDGIKNANTILSGAYINVTKGNGHKAKRFNVLNAAPDIASEKVGLSVTVVSERLMALTTGTPVYYRQIEVGSITHSELSALSDKVLITLNIQPEYQHLVHNDSQFWAVSGFNVDIGLTGATLKAESLKTILAGGIAFATPNPDKNSKLAEPFAQFKLAQEVNPDWLKWDTKIQKPAK